MPGAALALTPGIEVQEVKMDFNYSDAFGTESHPAYETLLLDCMIGDATLFTRTDEVEAAWAVIDPLIAFWEAGRGAPHRVVRRGLDRSARGRRAPRARRFQLAATVVSVVAS